ncbi:hypothetical protein SK128_020248, partial [Halocaridina rubra]
MTLVRNSLTNHWNLYEPPRIPRNPQESQGYTQESPKTPRNPPWKVEFRTNE